MLRQRFRRKGRSPWKGGIARDFLLASRRCVPGLPPRIIKATVLRLDLGRNGFHEARRMIRERIGMSFHAR